MTRVQLEIFLGILLASLAVAVLIYIGFTEERRMAEWTQAQQAEAIEVGGELFDINCTGCHGPNGQGIPGLAPALNDPHFFTGRVQEVGWPGSLGDYVISTVSTGRLVSTRPEYVGGGKPAMPAWSDRYGGPLRDDQIRDIANFVLNWEATATGQVEITQLATPTPSAEEAADPVAQGQQVFVTSGCNACHTISGISTGTVGPNLTQIGEVGGTREEGVAAEDYIHESIVTPNAYVVEGFPPNVMPQIYGEQLSDEQLDNLIAFLLAQK
jgi:mono/diheme cytochrome c family protein